MRRSRVGEVLLAEGLKWRQEETWFGARVDPDFAAKRGPSSGSTPRRRSAAQSSASTVRSAAANGPQASKSYPGRRLVKPAGPRAGRARREIDRGRRDVAGYVFGALQPATGAAVTATCERRTAANWVDFLGRVEGWIAPGAERVYAVVDNLNIHGGTDVLLFALAHPRWEFVFQPKYAAYLNLIEPWWTVLRSLALKGRRFDAWAEIERAAERAAAYWNQHKHPSAWGRRRRHRTPRRLGIAAPPNLTLI